MYEFLKNNFAHSNNEYIYCKLRYSWAAYKTIEWYASTKD